MPPSVTRTTSPESAALARARALARLLDTSLRVPGTRFRFGLDPILGLVPGIGDLAGVLLSSTILLTAARLGVPGPTLLRMGMNVGIEAVVGLVPLLGDLFDAGWRANVRNMALIDAHLERPGSTARRDRRWLISVAAGIVIVLIAIVGAGAWLIISLLRALGFG